jgi:hypothetical protein
VGEPRRHRLVMGNQAVLALHQFLYHLDACHGRQACRACVTGIPAGPRLCTPLPEGDTGSHKRSWSGGAFVHGPSWP